jgi:hypothetical protein
MEVSADKEAGLHNKGFPALVLFHLRHIVSNLAIMNIPLWLESGDDEATVHICPK